MTSSPPGRRWLVGVVALVGLVLAVRMATSSTDTTDGHATPSTSATAVAPPDAAAELQQEVDTAFAPAAFAAIEVIKAQQRWRDGSATDEDLGGEVLVAYGDLFEARDALVALDLPAGPDAATLARALALHRGAAHLYIEWLRIVTTVTTVDDAALQAELDRSSRRVLQLADRTYDVAQAVLEPVVPTDGVEIQTGPPVPSWAESNLLPGPPLVRDGDQPVGGEPQDASPPETDPDSLASRLAAAGAPTAATVGSLLRTGLPGSVAGLGLSVVMVAEQLQAGGEAHDGSIEVQLALLAIAEASWLAAGAGRIDDAATAARLLAASERLALISDQVWSAVVLRGPTVPDTGQMATEDR